MYNFLEIIAESMIFMSDKPNSQNEHVLLVKKKKMMKYIYANLLQESLFQIISTYILKTFCHQYI